MKKLSKTEIGTELVSKGFHFKDVVFFLDNEFVLKASEIDAITQKGTSLGQTVKEAKTDDQTYKALKNLVKTK
jgi:heat shock protein HspQ